MEEKSKFDSINRIHTLGPAGTNCEAAARLWLKRQGKDPSKVVLHRTLEEAAPFVNSEESALLGCIVYPLLHNLVFQNLGQFSLVDCFLMDTHEMVLAGKSGGSDVKVVASHPAPVDLVRNRDLEIKLVNSNSQAAIDCAAGSVDACITTMPAAQAEGLDLIESFGPVPMGFTIHAFRSPA